MTTHTTRLNIDAKTRPTIFLLSVFIAALSRAAYARCNRVVVLVAKIFLIVLSTIVFGVAATASAKANANAFQLKDTDGQAQSLSALKGKWVVVNFWATWCAPCVKEIPDLAAFAKTEGDKVRMIGIALDWDETETPAVDEKKVKAFAKKVGHTYPLVLGTDDIKSAFGKVEGLPTTIVYDPAGKIVYRKTGVVTQELLKKIMAGEKVKGSV